MSPEMPAGIRKETEEVRGRRVAKGGSDGKEAGGRRQKSETRSQEPEWMKTVASYQLSVVSKKCRVLLTTKNWQLVRYSGSWLVAPCSRLLTPGSYSSPVRTFWTPATSRWHRQPRTVRQSSRPFLLWAHLLPFTSTPGFPYYS